ncbi:hypothetical protein N658DRAFT_492515 [Parathielavia hyrcaniae]|uniref:Uncharacterized protein n=1 Tax=Parathielavia hyrcaniae TaxID=113614 RepID=A0AAN6QBW6_9PEZI|nr:hypothetical protein N658DRAFT_492515 [Parathielavia hyrcaniae]
MQGGLLACDGLHDLCRLSSGIPGGGRLAGHDKTGLPVAALLVVVVVAETRDPVITLLLRSNIHMYGSVLARVS